MHQPIPPIAPKLAGKRAANQPSESTTPQKAGFQNQALFGLLVAFVVAYGGFSLPIFHHAQPHYAPVTLGKIQIDPDGDDPREVLLYHWEDPKFSMDEQRGIAWMANGLALAGIWRLGKKIAKESQK